MLGNGANVFRSFRLGQKHSRYARRFAEGKVFAKPLGLGTVDANQNSVFR